MSKIYFWLTSFTNNRSCTFHTYDFRFNDEEFLNLDVFLYLEEISFYQLIEINVKEKFENDSEFRNEDIKKLCRISKLFDIYQIKKNLYNISTFTVKYRRTR